MSKQRLRRSRLPGRRRSVGRVRGLVSRRHVRRLVPAPIAAADLALFRRVAGLHAPVLDATLPRLSAAANRSALWLALAAALAARGGRFGRRAAVRGVGSLAVTSAVANLPGKLLTDRARPNLDVVPQARRLARVPTSTSFPSGHAASAAAFATAAGLELPRGRWPLAAAAAAIAFSRVYTGVHYPGDVAAGVALGASVALASRRTWPLAHGAPARGAPVAEAPRPGPDGDGLVVIANPRAGTGLEPGPARRLREALPRARIVEVDDLDRFEAALGEACRAARVIGIAGGDGSVGAAAAAAHDAGLPLLVVPGGSLNHLATDTGAVTVDDAIAAARDGEVVRMDLAEIDGKPFVNAAGFGIYPWMIDHRETIEGRIGKWPAALVSLIRVLLAAPPLEVEIDGERLRVWQVFAGNGRFTAPGITPTRRRRLDEGLVDVRVLRADRRWARLRFVAAGLAGRLRRSGAYEERLVTSLDVRSLEGPLRLALDGETVAGGAAFTVRKRPRPLLLLVPRS